VPLRALLNRARPESLAYHCSEMALLSRAFSDGSVLKNADEKPNVEARSSSE
jgi:hypothetical protein